MALQKREKIILGVMGVAVLYAGFEFLVPKSKPVEQQPGSNIAQKTSDLNNFVAGITAKVGKDTTKGLNELVFARAEKDWAQDPMLASSVLRAQKKAEEAAKYVPPPEPKVDFNYMGYIEAKGNRIAVVDGMEYREGEELQTKGYFLKTISPTNIVVASRKWGTEHTFSLQE